MHKSLYNKKILLYTGYQSTPWNPDSFAKRGMGGTETAIYNLSQQLSKLGYKVIVGGDVIEGEYDGVLYAKNNTLHKEFSKEHFRCIIGASYIHFIEEFSKFNYDKSFLCIHNTESTGGWWYDWWTKGDLSGRSMELLSSSKLTSIICLTNWHKEKFCKSFPELCSKVKIVGNGFNPDLIPQDLTKVPRSFIYSSHPERGLRLLLSKWHLIKEKKSDATLNVCTPEYGIKQFKEIQGEFSNLSSHGVNFIGQIDQASLYNLIAKSDYWLYPTNYEETYCITALEMQAMKTSVITTNFSALKDTVSNRGVLIEPEPDEDIFFAQFLNNFLYLNHSILEKNKIVERAFEWSKNQTWFHRAQTWSNLIEFN